MMKCHIQRIIIWLDKFHIFHHIHKVNVPFCRLWSNKRSIISQENELTVRIFIHDFLNFVQTTIIYNKSFSVPVVGIYAEIMHNGFSFWFKITLSNLFPPSVMQSIYWSNSFLYNKAHPPQTRICCFAEIGSSSLKDLINHEN